MLAFSNISALNAIYIYIPWEQKGCKRKSRGTKDHLLVDKMIMKHVRRKHRNLRMVWIEYKKAYDSVPHSWLLKSLDLIGAAENVKNFLEKVTKMWKTTLNSKVTGNVDIRRGIFEGDSLSALLLIIALIPLIVI